MSTSRLHRALLTAINLGADGLDAVAADRVRLANAVTLTLTAIAGLFTLPYMFATPHAGAALAQLGFAVLHGLGLLWTALQRIELARLWICTLYLTDVTVFATVVLPAEAGANVLLMLTPVLAVLVYEPRRQAPKYAATAMTLLAYWLTLSGVAGAPWLSLSPAEATLSSGLNFAAGLVGLMIGAHLITVDRLHTEGALSRLASTDHLTGLGNRRAMVQHGEALLRDGLASGEPLSVIMIDIDHFKAINDRYGHNLGDRVIRLVGRTLAESLRRTDRVGRYGGEEFICFLPGTPLSEARGIADKLRRRIAAATAGADDRRLQCTVSLGIAGPEDGSASLDRLIEQADAALYRAKHEGRDRVAAPAAG